MDRNGLPLSALTPITIIRCHNIVKYIIQNHNEATPYDIHDKFGVELTVVIELFHQLGIDPLKLVSEKYVSLKKSGQLKGKFKRDWFKKESDDDRPISKYSNGTPYGIAKNSEER